MLRYEVRQIHLPDLERFYLPIPKLGPEHVVALAADLERRGFEAEAGRLLKVRGDGTRFTVNPVGLASSAEELLDSLVPSLPRILGLPMSESDSDPYLMAKKQGRVVETQFFPRMEALRLWTSLRRAGECGLTPDEAAVLESLLKDSKGGVECLTDYPVAGCVPRQIGRHQYFAAAVPPDEFVSNLRTLTHHPKKSCYLPRNSVLRTERREGSGTPPPPLGEWSLVSPHYQNL